MKFANSKRPFRMVFFFFLMVCLLTGLTGISRAPARAAPPAQAALLSVVINEIAWAGTQSNPNGEWIELYNPGALAIDLTGWTLRATDGTPNITLSGTIAAGGYYLLERTADTTVSDITADLVYTGAMGNTVEVLELRDNTNTVIDTANQGGAGWFAGSATGYFSMERVDIVADGPTAWATNDGVNRNGLDSGSNPINGTPKQPNSATLVLTATVTPTLTFTATNTGTPTNTATATNTNTATATRTSTATAPPPMTVIINEVAWSGTVAASTDEWIELYNPGTTPINITNWRITADDGNPDITLTGTIPANGYFLVGRYTTIFSDVTVDQTFSGALDNAGEILYLLNAGGAQVDTANSDGGAWPAGVGSPTYASMERLGVIVDGPTAWATYAGTVPVAHDRNGNNVRGTPGQGNWILTVTVTPSPSSTPTRTPTLSRTPSPTRTPTSTRTPTRRPTITPPPLLAINEFVPRPGHDWNGDGEINTGDEYIELINHGSINVNLNGYRLDDEANIGSTPFSLPAITIKPGERIVFYGAVTGLLLSDGGDGVRLLRSNGQLVDAFNYTTVGYPDQAYCRLPDDGGADDWNDSCFPTPGLRNSRGSFGGVSGTPLPETLCPFIDIAPPDFVYAECDPFGNHIWRPAYWDDPGYLNGQSLPGLDIKGEVYAD